MIVFDTRQFVLGFAHWVETVRTDLISWRLLLPTLLECMRHVSQLA